MSNPTVTRKQLAQQRKYSRYSRAIYLVTTLDDEPDQQFGSLTKALRYLGVQWHANPAVYVVRLLIRGKLQTGCHYMNTLRPLATLYPDGHVDYEGWPREWRLKRQHWQRAGL